MKILFLNHNLVGRGTWFRCQGFARELVRQGHTVDLWTVANHVCRAGRRYEIDGVQVWETPRWGRVGSHDGGYAPVDILCRMGVICAGSWDIIHAFDHRPNVLFPWMLKRWFSNRAPGSPRFFSDWCDWWTAGGITTARRPFAWMDRIEQRIEEGSKRVSDGVTVISKVLEERARSISIPEAKILHVPAGVDTTRFPLRSTRDARHALRLDEGSRWLGFVGFSLWDLEMLARVVRMVFAKRDDVKLLVLGGGVEEKAKRSLLEVDPSGERIVMPGVVPFVEVPAHLSACDVLLLPMQDTIANRARIPNKLADYYAACRPVVASDVGDTGTWVREHKSGVSAVDETTFAESVLDLLQNPQRAESMGKQGRQIAESDWSYQKLTKQLEHFYTHLM